MNPRTESFPRLVADIGGTHARFGWVDAPGQAPAELRTLAVAEHAGPLEAARVYLAGLAAQAAARGQAPPPAPRRAAFALATPITGDRVELTNAAWSFSRSALARALGCERLLLLNDFEALARSLPTLAPSQWRACGGPSGPPPVGHGTVLAVVGPGTGLGIGAVLRTHGGWQAVPGEGGHVTLAAGDALEDAVLEFVRRRHAHVSAERLLSGMGLPLLHEALAAVHGRRAEPVADAAALSAAADGGDAQAVETFARFFGWLGSVAGNVALTLGARGGVYIAGGIVPRMAERFVASDFRRRFEAKGRFADYLAAVPTRLVTDTRTALAGAAAALDDASLGSGAA